MDSVWLRRVLVAAQHNILDIRAAARTAAGHLAGSATLPLEPELRALSAPRRDGWLLENLPSIFLPPRHEPLLVVAECADLAEAVAAHLTARGRGGVAAMALDGRDAAELPDDLRGRGRSARVLWRPPSVLARWAHLLPPPAAGAALDLACGSGRAAVWLARRGWRVTGVEHQPQALALASRLAASSGVGLELRDADLTRPDGVPPGRWAVILLLRFLDRDLLGRLAARVRRGSVIIVSTFRDAPGFLGNPRRRHRLQRDEAAGIWTAREAELLVHEEGFDGDGRPAASAIYRWRGGIT